MLAGHAVETKIRLASRQDRNRNYPYAESRFTVAAWCYTERSDVACRRPDARAGAPRGRLDRTLLRHIDGRQQHWLRPASDTAIATSDVLAMASFPLLPFCNRLRAGRASFNGQQIVLPLHPPGTPHALHGGGWLQPWRVSAQDTQSVQLEMTHSGADAAWPWPFAFHASQLYALRADRLTVTLEVENRSRQPMPIGIGHHPFLPDRTSARLTVDLAAMWAADDEVMPTALVTPPLLDALRAGAAVAEIEQDNNFIGWDRLARVDWPAGATRRRASSLRMTSTAPLDYFVLYSPAQHDFFCIEAVSNCTDWMNLAQGQFPQAQIGGSVIAPGERYCGTFWLEPSWQ